MPSSQKTKRRNVQGFLRPGWEWAWAPSHHLLLTTADLGVGKQTLPPPGKENCKVTWKGAWEQERGRIGDMTQATVEWSQLSMLSSTVATSHQWVFRFEWKWNEIRKSVPQSHQPPFKCSVVTSGQCIEEHSCKPSLHSTKVCCTVQDEGFLFPESRPKVGFCGLRCPASSLKRVWAFFPQPQRHLSN